MLIDNPTAGVFHNQVAQFGHALAGYGVKSMGVSDVQVNSGDSELFSPPHPVNDRTIKSIARIKDM